MIIPLGGTAAPLVHSEGFYLSVDGVRMWCEMEGAGDPLLLIAGGPGASHTYMHGFSPLAKHHRLIYFDALGCGRSDKAKGPEELTLERAVRDVEALRSALGIKRWDVLGHSYGGVVAQEYGLKYPASVDRLVLANTLISGEAWQKALDYTNEQLQNQYPEVWERTQKIRAAGQRSSSIEHQKAYEVSPALTYFFDGSNLNKTVFEINQDVYYGMAGDDADFEIGPGFRDVDFRPRLKELRMPVLVLAGRFDRIVCPSLTLQFQKYAPQARFVMFEKSGHLPFAEEPDETFAVLEDFFARRNNHWPGRNEL